MRKFVSVIVVFALVLMSALSASVFAWVQTVKGGIVRFTVTPENVEGEDKIFVSQTENGEYSTDLQHASGTIGICHSTDGVTFTDKNGNPSTKYAEYLFYIKGDKKYDGLNITGIQTDCQNQALRVAVEYYGSTWVFTPSAFNEKYFAIPVRASSSAEVKVRIWLEGDSITTPYTEPIHIALHMEGK